MPQVLAVRVPASCSNLGAGFDCVGLALDLWLEVRLLPGRAAASYRGEATALDPDRDIMAAHLTRRRLLDDAHLEVSSGIPIGKGLGSSAAAHAAAVALGQLAGAGRLDQDAVFHDVATREGHPDNAGPAVYGGLFLASTPPARLRLHPSIAVALAVPDATVSTRAARAVLPEQVPRTAAVGQATRAAGLIRGLTEGEAHLITFGMDDWIAVPHRRAMIPGFDRAVEAGRSAGAYGVTISGAGSSLVALTGVKAAGSVARAMAEALTTAGNPARALTPAVSLRGLELLS
ncbi:MAG TPA: homoserine kinase [Gemmatimonadales bacterium]|nr:homoserine kinase [Gemmatimonadales bacterium]